MNLGGININFFNHKNTSSDDNHKINANLKLQLKQAMDKKASITQRIKDDKMLMQKNAFNEDAYNNIKGSMRQKEIELKEIDKRIVDLRKSINDISLKLLRMMRPL